MYVVFQDAFGGTALDGRYIDLTSLIKCGLQTGEQYDSWDHTRDKYKEDKH